MRIAVEHLLVGMMVDLEGDQYADPESENSFFRYELAEVAFSLQETPDCVLVGIEGVDWFGFPNGHKINVKRFDREVYDLCKDDTAKFIADFQSRKASKG